MTVVSITLVWIDSVMKSAIAPSVKESIVTPFRRCFEAEEGEGTEARSGDSMSLLA